MKEYKFNIKGAYGETNFGDDLLMLVFESYFRKEFPNSKLNFEGENSVYPKKMLSENSTYNTENHYNWLIYGGGTQFFSFKENNMSFIEKVQIVLKNPRLILNKIKKPKTKNQESKVAFIGFGLGPFYNNKLAIENAKFNVSKANFVGVRDDVSLNYCEEWNVPSILGADVVFSSYFDLPSLEKKIKKKSDKKIGIIVRDWEFEDTGSSYISKLKEFYNKEKKNSDIQYIVFAPLKDKNWIKDLADENVLIWNPETYSISDFLNELNKFDLIISARYHGAIIASLLNKPVICVEIEPKLRILTEQMKEILLWEKPFSIDKLYDLIKGIDYDTDYSHSLNEQKKKSDLMLEIFKNKLINNE